MPHKNLAKLFEKLERNSGLAIQWLEDDYMNLNTGKSHLLIFGHNLEQWAQIGKDMVWQENKVKFLRKTIDSLLIFDSHILNICSKTNNKLSVLCKAKDTL